MATTKKTTEEKSMKDLYGSASEPKKAEAKKADEKSKRSGNAYRILVKPLITEKASILGAENKYFFEVAIRANKIEVAKAIEEVYGIKPIKVNVVSMIGKHTRYGRVFGKRKDWKKAIVTLPKGQSIKVYEGV